MSSTNQSKRQFIKALPLVALGGIAMKVGEHEAQAIEIKPDKRYVLMVNCDITQADMDGLRKTLTKRGLDDMLIIAGPAEIYELEQPAK